MSPTSIFTPLANTSAISSSPCLSTYSSNTIPHRLGDDRFEHLLLGHLVRPHQVEFELAEGRRRQVPEVADPRHGRRLAEADARGAGADATIVR